MIYSWHKTGWGVFTRLLPKLPHAILVHGPRGSGDLEFAKHAASLLLCNAALSNTFEACGKCSACVLLRKGNHPDFFLVQPEADAAESQETTENGEPAGDKKKKPSTQIKIEQVRDLIESIQTGTHQGGRRVLVIAPADAMNGATANALLKTLEEPPPDTVILLVSGAPERLLPTVRSRCQSIALGQPDRQLALCWLQEHGIERAAGEAQLALSGGAPLKALAAATTETALDYRMLIERLALRRDPFAAADVMAKSDPVSTVDWLQRWVCDLLTLRMGGRVRYHPEFEGQLQDIARAAPSLALLRLARQLVELRAIATHPVNPRLFSERLALDYLDSVGGPPCAV